MMTLTEALETVVKPLLEEQLSGLSEWLRVEPGIIPPARIRHKLHHVPRWQAILNGESPTPDDIMLWILPLLQEEIQKWALAYKWASGPMADKIPADVLEKATRWQRASEAAAAIRY